MNFFEHQELARRNSRRLIVLFVLAVIAIVRRGQRCGDAALSRVRPADRHALGAVAAAERLLLHQHRRRAGTDSRRNLAGDEPPEGRRRRAVAQMVGAREVDTSTRDLLDRRLINVVEEMAIASGVPMPRVFVMDDENSINAFAAGHSINDAVVAVTRGTLTRLSRDELQGVIAHEFSHILNGDMKLNLRLIGVLYGLLIVALAGRFLLEIGGRSRGGGDRSSGSAIAVLFVAGLAAVDPRLHRRVLRPADQGERVAPARVPGRCQRGAVHAQSGRHRRRACARSPGCRRRPAWDRASTIRRPSRCRICFSGRRGPAFVRGIFATHPPLDERLQRIYGRSVERAAGAGECRGAGAGRPEPGGNPGRRRSPIEFIPSERRSRDRPGAAEERQPGGRTGGGERDGGHRCRRLGGRSSSLRTSARCSAVTATSRSTRPSRRCCSRCAAQPPMAMRAQLLVLALLVDKDRDLRGQQRTLIAEAYGGEAAQMADALPGAGAAPAARRAPAAGRSSRCRRCASCRRSRARPCCGRRTC